ncbi:hypothetical protein EPO04_00170 [Patescibacteria group bacterium]|nr:MAG: hypothetical protein EPO04_00170 [Patescibacteria group bacterium]
MTNLQTTPVFKSLLEWAQATSQSSDSTQPVDGQAYNQPGQNIFTQTIIKLPNGGQIDLKLTLPQASSDFEWLAEITVDDTSTGEYKHYLLRKAGDIVETYGKQVIDVSEADAQGLLDYLRAIKVVNA